MQVRSCGKGDGEEGNFFGDGDGDVSEEKCINIGRR